MPNGYFCWEGSVSDRELRSLYRLNHALRKKDEKKIKKEMIFLGDRYGPNARSTNEYYKQHIASCENCRGRIPFSIKSLLGRLGDEAREKGVKMFNRKRTE